MGRILLVDENPVTRGAYRLVLSAVGHTVDTASDGYEAVGLLRSSSYDAVLSDASMPHTGGAALLETVSSQEDGLPVVLLTGDPPLDTTEKAIELGAFGFLRKPVELAALERTMAHAVEVHGLTRLKRRAREMMKAREPWQYDPTAIDARFARALDSMWVAFQPIASWREKRIFGYEALVRTDEPTMCHPDELLNAAEQLGRVHDVGRAVRTRVAEAATAAPDKARLFINLHVLDLEDETLYTPSSELAPFAERVVLEVTERVSLNDIKDVRSRVAELRGLGFQLALDDLGAGYAGLAALAQLEPEVVKLDMSLVRDVHRQATKQGVIRSVAKLCDELGMLVVTEGVETAEERDTLVGLGCDLLQGFLFAEPARDFPSTRW